MDLEVSEPIDFSSGDHQHLVQKAADDNIQSKSARSYGTSSSTHGPQQTHGNPHSKAGEQGDTYVVEISAETTTEDSNPLSGPFSEAAIRRAFIVKVFFLLSVQLLITGAIISLFLFWKALRVWVVKNPWFTYALLPAFFVVFIILACCGKLCRQVPANYILLGLFTILQGLLLGTVSVFCNAEEVLWATAATALVTISLTLFALQTKCDFTLLSGMLFVLLFVLIIYGILLIFIRSYWLHLLYAGLGTVIFSLYLVMDVQLMVGGRHHHSNLHPEEYVFAALNIYMDIINLFLFILQLIGLGR
ncbi:protein lifeguard 2-like [Balaenoptera acutorostrata]|uniref:Protein lifeguard 2-like n=1 Tax=Balaenoptera acutorostrata TaxID=9767 RepID=A0A384B991_BALAC|nr:protein lifeguard 2-like [Balaenoptera acutorostrata]